MSSKPTVFAEASKRSQAGSISGPGLPAAVRQSAKITAAASRTVRAVMRERSVLQRNQALFSQRRKGALAGAPSTAPDRRAPASPPGPALVADPLQNDRPRSTRGSVGVSLARWAQR